MAYIDKDYDKIISALKKRINTSTSVQSNTNQQVVINARKYREQEEKTLKNAQNAGYNSNLTVQSSQVKNKYYNGDDYAVTFDGFNVTLKNKTKNYTKTFNIYNFVSSMPEKDKIEFLKKIQTLPGEVLEDLSVEMDRLKSSTGQNMHINSNPNFTAGGYYSPDNDSITTSPKHIVHELGHAVDYDAKGKSSAANDPTFKALFEQEMKQFIQAGNQRYDYNDNSTWANGVETLMKKSNYCTANEREMFAEIYTLCTTGECKSGATITQYFPKTFARGKELLQQARTNNINNRHNSPTRNIINSLS